MNTMKKYRMLKPKFR